MQVLNKQIHNGYWLASLLVLCGLTAYVHYSDGDSGKDFDEAKFTLEINSVITSVNISSTEGRLQFDYVNGDWVVNDKFIMDPGMRDAFFTVISSIRIKRPVSNVQLDSIESYLSESGLQVEIMNNQDIVKSYTVGGSEIAGISYFMDEEGYPYEVVLPGYDSYVAGIYSVPEIDWRNRFLFELDWSNLKSIVVDYKDGRDGFTINYKEDFFYLNEETQPIDSASMFDYIGELRNLQAQKFLAAGENQVFDSLENESLEATIMVEVIGEPAQMLEIFERREGRWIMARMGSDLLVHFDPRALRPILIQTDDWKQ